jgi:hypothetical protein
MFNSTKIIITAIILSGIMFTGMTIHAQTLYGLEDGSDNLVTLDPADGSTLSIIGGVAGTFTVGKLRLLAMDPTTGIMYVNYSDNTSTWHFGTINLATAFITDINSNQLDHIRGAVFDTSGKLWAVNGASGANSHDLVSVNLSTGATTVENATLPGSKNKISYAPDTDTLYILSLSPGRLDSLSPSDPASLTQITLSGDTLLSSGGGLMVYDSQTDLIYTVNAVNQWYTITPSGVVTLVTTSNGSGNLKGSAFDQAGTVPVEISGFDLK